MVATDLGRRRCAAAGLEPGAAAAGRQHAGVDEQDCVRTAVYGHGGAEPAGAVAVCPAAVDLIRQGAIGYPSHRYPSPRRLCSAAASAGSAAARRRRSLETTLSSASRSSSGS